MQSKSRKPQKKTEEKSEPRMSTAYEIAEKLGVHKATINRIAKIHEIGTPWGMTRIRLFSDSEVEQIKGLCRVKKGNPNFSRKK